MCELNAYIKGYSLMHISVTNVFLYTTNPTTGLGLLLFAQNFVFNLKKILEDVFFCLFGKLLTFCALT